MENGRAYYHGATRFWWIFFSIAAIVEVALFALGLSKRVDAWVLGFNLFGIAVCVKGAWAARQQYLDSGELT